MSMITSATIAALQTTVSMGFKRAYKDTDTWFQNITTTLPSNVATNTYAWAAEVPGMREWLGPRTINNIFNHDYQLANRDWEDTIGVDRNSLDDDNLGVFTNVIVPGLGKAAKRNPQLRVRDSLESLTQLGFDGLVMFSAAHDLDPAGNQSNLNTSRALTATNYETSYSAMLNYTAENGEPLQVRPTILLVPPALEIAAKRIVNTDLVMDLSGTAGVQNVMLGSSRIVVAPELTSATTWYLIDDSRPINPFIWQNRKSPVLVSQNAPDSPALFSQRRYTWGVDSRGAAGYSLWFLAQKNIA